MKQYTVKELADLAGVTVRTLHYYDEIGVLQPSGRTESGYRLYNQKDVMRLQQILLYKEFEIPLTQIQSLLDDPDFDITTALYEHKEKLVQKHGRYKKLIETIDKTLQKIEGHNELITDKELYEGFSVQQREEYHTEAVEKWGNERVQQSIARVKKFTKSEWEQIKSENEDLHKQLVQVMNTPVSDAAVQKLVDTHRQSIEVFYNVTEEIYRGLADMYVQDERFTAFYEKYAPGLAHFLSDAMKYYCDHGFKK